jgi:CDGSH-type Zn-finger protein
MSENEAMKITVMRDGPYVVTGGVPLSRQVIEADEEGTSREWREAMNYPHRRRYDLCRCGGSANKPFCDSSHETNGFKSDDHANVNFADLNPEEIEGSVLLLYDAEYLCAFARFCDADGGIWDRAADAADEDSAQSVIEQGAKCPGGRMVVWRKESAEAAEPALEPSIGIVEDKPNGIGGPVWVRGGIPVVHESGHQYEVRNRVTLCRCGASTHKPFCDGSHASIEFKDENAVSIKAE